MAHAPAAAAVGAERGERPGEALGADVVAVVGAVEVLQRRVGHRDVVALVVDVADRLPVDGDLGGPGRAGRGEVVEAVVGEVGGEGGEGFGDRWLRAGAAADEDEAVPDLAFHRLQAVVAAVEVAEGLRAGRAAQGAVEVVDPAVERADEGVPALARVAGRDAGAAVAAEVVDGADHAVLAADDEGAVVGDVERDPGPGLGQVGDVADDLPVGGEELGLLEREEGRAVVGPAGEAAAVPGLGDRFGDEGGGLHGWPLRSRRAGWRGGARG